MGHGRPQKAHKERGDTEREGKALPSQSSGERGWLGASRCVAAFLGERWHRHDIGGWALLALGPWNSARHGLLCRGDLGYGDVMSMRMTVARSRPRVVSCCCMAEGDGAVITQVQVRMMGS